MPCDCGLVEARVAYSALLAEGSASSEGAEAVAYVPVHPRNGPLWANTTPEPNAERLPSYPLMPLYTHPQPAQGEPVVKDRDADRARFPNAEFNCWLDDGISDAGHTVYDSLGSVFDAWQGWQAREYYGPKSAQGEHEQRSSEGSELPVLERYGIEWRGPHMPIALPMPDGYWTPWHIAEEALRRTPERRPIADEVVERACAADERMWALIAAAEKAGAIKDDDDEGSFWTLRCSDFAALESALPRGLPAGSDARDAAAELLAADLAFDAAEAAWREASTNATGDESPGEWAKEAERRWQVFGDASRRRRAAIAAQQRQGGACVTCNGRGEVGGFVNAESGYQTDPCPDCSQKKGE